MKPIIVITGGGTGGHVFPALALAEELAALGIYDLVWIGSTKGIERQLVRRWGIRFIGIPTGKLRRYLSLENIIDVFKTLAGIFRSIAVLRKLKPVIVFSKGGYVSVPPVLAAGLLGIAVISHESDSDPGLATRLNLRWSSKVCVPYSASLSHYPANKAILTGNPVRKEIFLGQRQRGLSAVGFSDLPSDKPVLFVQGGSLGARQINQIVNNHLQVLLQHYRIVHQSGSMQENVIDIDAAYFRRDFFSQNYADVLASADLVLSRAGAGSIWELAARSIPAVLVPLTRGSRGDQLLNAQLCVSAGACELFQLLPDPAADDRQLVATLIDLAHNKERRARMASAWASIYIPSAAKNIAKLVLETIAERQS